MRRTTIALLAALEASVAALIGQGGLGQLMRDGFERDFRTPLVVGVALTVALAVVADLFVLGIQHLVTPWTRRSR